MEECSAQNMHHAWEIPAVIDSDINRQRDVNTSIVSKICQLAGISSYKLKGRQLKLCSGCVDYPEDAL